MDPDNLDNEPDTSGPSDDEPTGEMEHKHRRHGYRGYPNNPNIGGDVHTGSGFGGVGSTSEPGAGQGIVGEKTRESVEEIGDEDDTES
jgi:hypothetical protein